jgi:cell wall-associated NlpC family hydrolase
MSGKHRKPSSGPLLPIAAGATVATLALLTGSVITTPHTVTVKSTARTAPLPAVRLALPPLDVASAALYLTPLPAPELPAPDPQTSPQTVKVATPKPFTITTTGSSRAVRAVNTAMAMRGVAYSYGGTSRAGIDCSGLTQLAFRSAGVTLPRTAAAQSTVGRPVTLSQVQPGDLLFYYSPIEHVVMSTGNGMVVEASQPGVPVHQVPLYTSGLTAIRRIVG